MDEKKQAYTYADETGIWHVPVKNDGSMHLAPIRLCDLFSVAGEGIDEAGMRFYVLNYDDNKHCIIARGDVGTSEGWRQLRQYINIPSKRQKLDLLTEYVQAVDCNANVWRITDVAGWHEDAYVLPNGEILGRESNLYFNGRISNSKRNAYTSSGSLADWKSQIGKYAAGNSRLCLVIGAAFAAPVLRLLNIDGGIFHLYGESTGGKSTAQRVAQSVWGQGREACESWNGTAYALINNAAARNDGLLCLDEMGEDSNGKGVDQSIYALANGKGRALGAKDGGNRPEIRFRVLALSSGETSLEAHMSKHGRVAMAGHLVRCPSIAHKLEHRHDFSSLRDFANHLNDAVCRFYGTAGRAFIGNILNNQAAVELHLRERYELYLGKLHTKHNLNAQHSRTARLFAAAMAAIELACGWDLCGIDTQTALEGIMQTFADWLQAQPKTVSFENAQIVRNAMEYMQAMASFFQNPDGFTNFSAHPFPGYVVSALNKEDDLYYVFQKHFREQIVKGFDERKVKEVLHDIGWLQKDADKRWGTQLYGKSAIGDKKRLGRFLVFIGIAPPVEFDDED